MAMTTSLVTGAASYSYFCQEIETSTINIAVQIWTLPATPPPLLLLLLLLSQSYEVRLRTHTHNSRDCQLHWTGSNKSEQPIFHRAVIDITSRTPQVYQTLTPSALILLTVVKILYSRKCQIRLPSIEDQQPSARANLGCKTNFKYRLVNHFSL